MSRFRLRFLLQEFDLPIGEIVIGRSPDCHVTIEDPLISRRHAKIVVTGTTSTLVDLGSRNGLRVNGTQVIVPVLLNDADRIRLGAQELVFFQVGSEQRSARQTGAMLFCNKCATPFPEGARVCPHCGAVPVSGRDDETMSGLFLEPRRTWILQLFGEVIERALATHKLSEAERILQRACDEFSVRVASSEPVEWPRLAQIADYAIRLAMAQKDLRWIRWVTETFKSLDCVPSELVIDRLADAGYLPGVPAMVADVIEHWDHHHDTLNPDEVASLGRLASLVRTAGG